MLINGQRYCDLCHGVIVFGQKHVQVRGKSQYDASHYHYRFSGDCWERQRRYASPGRKLGEQQITSVAPPERA